MRSALDGMGNLTRAVKVFCLPRHVKIRFVQRNIFRGIGIGIPYLVKLCRYRLVFIKIRAHINAVGTAAIGLLDIHGGMDTVFSCLIAAGSYHAAFIRHRADDKRFATQRRMISHFNRGVEGIHIHMNDDLIHSVASQKNVVITRKGRLKKNRPFCLVKCKIMGKWNRMNYALLNLSLGFLHLGQRQSSGRSSKATPSCSAGSYT